MPIHDHLHWSLVIICHAGVPAEEDSCTPWILHLDSMTCGNHPHLKPCTSVCGSALCARTGPRPKTGILLAANPNGEHFAVSRHTFFPVQPVTTLRRSRRSCWHTSRRSGTTRCSATRCLSATLTTCSIARNLVCCSCAPCLTRFGVSTCSAWLAVGVAGSQALGLEHGFTPCEL